MVSEEMPRGTGSDERNNRSDADLELEQIIYRISHDLRASARALKELPAWIHEDLDGAGVDLPEESQRYLALLRRHAFRLDQFFADLLTYSRVGRMQPIEEVSLDDALDRAIAGVALPSGFRLRRTLKDVTLRAGAQDIETLFVSLLSNAMKHHGGDSGWISVTCKAEGADLVIDFVDDGPGIAPEHRDQVFGFMTKLQSRDEVEGSGLGLTIAERICQTYGGSIAAHAGPDDQGCKIQITLPAAR